MDEEEVVVERIEKAGRERLELEAAQEAVELAGRGGLGIGGAVGGQEELALAAEGEEIAVELERGGMLAGCLADKAELVAELQMD